MTSVTADIIGICGSIMFIGAFIYANMVPTLNKLLFNTVNLIGAVLLLISLSVNFNLAAFILEVAWGIIALIGIVRALQKRRV